MQQGQLQRQGHQAYVKPTGHIDCPLLRGHARICTTTVEGFEEIEDREPSAMDSVENQRALPTLLAALLRRI